MMAPQSAADEKAISPGLTPFAIHITSFEPEPYEVKRQIPVIVRPLTEGYEANFFDANIHASGDTEEEALRNLKAIILDTYDNLIGHSAEALGPEPARHLQVLQHYITGRS